MSDLADYSGAFNPRVTYDDFSKEFLLKALKSYAQYIRRLDGIWYLTVKEADGDDAAFNRDRQVWDRMELHDLDMTRRLFNITGNDVPAMLKALQMSPWTWNLDHSFELRGPNVGIWTVKNCPTLLALEREGEGREKRICCQIEPHLYQIRAHAVNPRIKVTPLRLPPRRNPDEIHCQWEFRLEDGA